MRVLSLIIFWLGAFSVLAGGAVVLGYTKPLESVLFQSSAPIPTPPPSTPIDAGKIISAVIDQTCQLNVISDRGNVNTATNFDPEVAECELYTLSKLSDSGQYVALEDLSAEGVDALVKVFSYKLQKITLLHDLGEFSILDLLFLPDDQLAVLMSQGTKGAQKIYVYNLNYLFDQYTSEAEAGEFSQQAIELATGELPIPSSAKRAATIALDGQQLHVYSESEEQPMLSFSLDTI